MSSSVGNNIPLLAAPEEMFGRTMRIPDEQLPEWWTLVAEQPVPAGVPMEAKLALARLIVARSHGEEAARAAEEHFTRVVRRHEAPEAVEEARLEGPDPLHLPSFSPPRWGSPRATGGGRSTRAASSSRRQPVAGYDHPWSELDGRTHSRLENAASCGLFPVDAGVPLATIHGLPERAV